MQYKLTTGLGKTFEQLTMNELELNVVDGLIMPNLRMQKSDGRCAFLREDNLCNIHTIRPGICRMFPLGRYWEDETHFKYIVQKGECNKDNLSKIKLKKWLGIEGLAEYDSYIVRWHEYVKQLQAALPGLSEDNVKILNTFNLRVLENKDSIIKMETNIDDCSGEVLGFVMERLLKAGARDVHYVPAFMKKNRPAWVLNVICKEEDMEKLQNIIFEETTTIGIRYTRMERAILQREQRIVQTPWGEAQVKVCTLNGKEQFYPEYESVAELSRANEIPFAEIYQYLVSINKGKQ